MLISFIFKMLAKHNSRTIRCKTYICKELQPIHTITFINTVNRSDSFVIILESAVTVKQPTELITKAKSRCEVAVNIAEVFKLVTDNTNSEISNLKKLCHPE